MSERQRERERQTDRQTERQRETHRERHTEREIATHNQTHSVWVKGTLTEFVDCFAALCRPQLDEGRALRVSSGVVRNETRGKQEKAKTRKRENKQLRRSERKKLSENNSFERTKVSGKRSERYT